MNIKGGCGRSECRVSTGICGSLTFGSGRLSPEGYWEFPCEKCREAYSPALCDFCQSRNAVMAVTINALPGGVCVDQFNKCGSCSIEIVEKVPEVGGWKGIIRRPVNENAQRF